MALVVGRYEGLFTRRSHISRGRKIWLLRVNKASLPTTRAINCLLYRNYTHNNNTCFKLMWKRFRVTSSAILFTIESRRATTLCVLSVGVAMRARGSGIHDMYFPGARGLAIHEVLSSWHYLTNLTSMRYYNIICMQLLSTLDAV